MTNKDIHRLYGETANYGEPEAFASDATLSLMDPENPDQEINIVLFDQLCILWHVANDPFKALLRRMGLTQSQCSTRFCIPLRTVQSWALKERVCPAYIRLMMAELMGVIRLRDEY